MLYLFFFSVYENQTSSKYSKTLKLVTSRCYNTFFKLFQKAQRNHLNIYLQNSSEKASCIISRIQTSQEHGRNPDQTEVLDSFVVGLGGVRFYYYKQKFRSLCIDLLLCRRKKYLFALPTTLNFLSCKHRT